MHAEIAAIRHFSRFYTQRIGVLHEGLLGSPFSLAEGRVLYEIGTAPNCTAAWLAARLDLDRGYLSRILKSFDERRLIARSPSAADGRAHLLRLTAEGVRHFAAIDARSAEEIGTVLQRLPATARARLVAALAEAEALLGGAAEVAPVRIRGHRPGDLGWIVHRQAMLYAQEYGSDGSFEALLAGIAADFLNAHDPAREACWLAERDGAPLGSVMLVAQDAETAKLRVLYVEKAARGLGIGRLLVRHCIDQGRAFGYRRMRLWTNSVLCAARRIYETKGFVLTESAPHRSFGQDLVGEVWEKAL
ncbi:MAG: MarR family transcriptional regulator [Rhodospirillales bacterium]|nr:MarR family transcriptional regulator [Rhodospirillales bacterium]